jgi:SdrD B-like domain/Prenyltransferase and squalene oxidase repeat
MCALLLLLAAMSLALPRTASAKTLGEWTQPDVNAAIEHGVSFLVGQQNPDGSIGTSFPVAETATAITSFGVQDQGHFGKLPADQQAALQKAVNWLLTQQTPAGDFGQDDGGFLQTYDTGLALLALSFSSDVPTTPAGGVATAIANARSFLIGDQETQGGTGPGETCQTTGANGSGFGGQQWCGGWDYESKAKFGEFRSDESNTGFAVTGLAATGGLPPATAALNAGWQRNVQEFSGNTFGSSSLRNDGGAGYEPGLDFGDFSSNTNDSGTNLFSFGFDGVPASDPAVQASLKFDGDALNAFELQKEALLAKSGTNPLDAMHMVFHTGSIEDGACTPDSLGCDWSAAGGEGGFHYSMFSITKGFSQYVPASLGDPSNYYAKVVDLLLEQQHSEGESAGSWPVDTRDDPTPVMATGFAILALGRVGAPAQLSGTVYNDANNNATFDGGDTGLSGWTVFVDVNGSGSPAGQPSAVTAGDGSYSIQNIPEGSFAVRVVGQSGFTCTQPGSGCSYPEQFASDVNLTGLNFGESKPTTATPAAPTPATSVLAVKEVAPTKGTAHIASSTRGCVARSGYLASVRGKSIASVTFTLDGHTIKTLRKPTSRETYAVRVNVRAGSTHHLAIHVAFTAASKTPATTLHRTLARCAARKVVLPRFTG